MTLLIYQQMQRNQACLRHCSNEIAESRTDCLICLTSALKFKNKNNQKKTTTNALIHQKIDYKQTKLDIPLERFFAVQVCHIIF